MAVGENVRIVAMNIHSGAALFRMKKAIAEQTQRLVARGRLLGK
jgi:hypothetical protein